MIEKPARFSLAIHGGAGTIIKALMTPAKELAYCQAITDALQAGQSVLSSNGRAIDAVIAAVVSLENNALFNAGKGAVFTHEGIHEMDASVMCGKNLNAGAVAGVQHIKNPVLLAKAVMEKTEHVFLYGYGAETLGKQCNLEFEEPAYFHDSFRYDQWLAVKDSEKTMLDHSHESSEKKFAASNN